MDIELKFKIFLVILRAFFIFSKEARHEFKNKKITLIKQEEFKKKYENAVWGMSYSLFDGEELLEASIKSVRSQVDYINVVYQDVNWYGDKSDTNLYEYLIALKEKGLIDEIIKFEPDFNKPARKNELNKRNLGLKYAKKAGCNYFMCMDCDEFYFEKDLAEIKEYIVKNGITHAFCAITDYWTKPTERFLNMSFYAVPIFSKINRFSKLKTNKWSVVKSDSTRTVMHTLNAKYYVFLQYCMHHMSFVRKDMTKKLSASSTECLRQATLEEILGNRKFVNVENDFNIEIS